MRRAAGAKNDAAASQVTISSSTLRLCAAEKSDHTPVRQLPTQPRRDLCGPEPPQCAARGWVACSPTTPLTLTEHERVSRRPPTGPGSFPKAGSPRQAVALRRTGCPGQPAAAACCCCCVALPTAVLCHQANSARRLRVGPAKPRAPPAQKTEKCGRLPEE